MPSPRSKTLLLNLGLAAVVGLLALWGADLAFRYYERNWLEPRLPELSGDEPVNLGALRYNEAVVKRGTVEGEFRILSLGDSFAYSVMEPDLSYSGVLERKLNAAGLDQQVQVVNLGEPATGTRQYRLAYDYWSRILEHQGVVFMIFIGNDLLDDAYLHAGLEWAPNDAVLRGGNPILDPGNPRVPRKFPLRMLDYAYAWLMSSRTRSVESLPQGYNWAGLTDFDHDTFLRINARYMENFDPRELPHLLPGYEQVLRLLQRAAQLREAGIKVAVAMGPSEAQVDDALRAEVLAHDGRTEQEFDLGLPVRIIQRLRDIHAPEVLLVDLTPDFRARARRSGESLFFRRNTHWDRAGNHLAASVLSDALRAHWFGGPPMAAETSTEQEARVLLDQAAIDDYLRPLQGFADAGGARISGAIRSVHLLDGIADRNDNWAVAPLHTPVRVEFAQPLALRSIRVHLYDADGRSYRYRLEVFADGAWRTLDEGDGAPVSGIGMADWNGGPVSAIRLTGLFNSATEHDPANVHIHLRELELLQ